MSFLRIHMTLSHSGDPSVEKSVFAEKQAIAVGNFQCSSCSNTYLNKRSLQKHFRIKHKNDTIEKNGRPRSGLSSFVQFSERLISKEKAATIQKLKILTTLQDVQHSESELSFLKPESNKEKAPSLEKLPVSVPHSESTETVAFEPAAIKPDPESATPCYTRSTDDPTHSTDDKEEEKLVCNWCNRKFVEESRLRLHTTSEHGKTLPRQSILGSKLRNRKSDLSISNEYKSEETRPEIKLKPEDYEATKNEILSGIKLPMVNLSNEKVVAEDFINMSAKVEPDSLTHPTPTVPPSPDIVIRKNKRRKVVPQKKVNFETADEDTLKADVSHEVSIKEPAEEPVPIEEPVSAKEPVSIKEPAEEPVPFEEPVSAKEPEIEVEELENVLSVEQNPMVQDEQPGEETVLTPETIIVPFSSMDSKRALGTPRARGSRTFRARESLEAQEPYAMKKKSINELIRPIDDDSNESLVCIVCNFTFRAEQIELHIRQMHEGFPRRQCFVCGRKFYSVDIARSHFATVHRNVFNFQCKTCGKGFYHYPKLIKHVLMGHKSDVIPDREDCRVDPNIPIRVSVGRKTAAEPIIIEDEVVCFVCGVTFNFDKMDDHVSESHPLFPKTRCFICGRSYSSADNTRYHIKTVHLGLFNFKCTQCDRVYYNYSRLSKHFILTHKFDPLPSKNESRIFKSDVQSSKVKDGESRCGICRGIFPFDAISKHVADSHKNASFTMAFPKNQCHICGARFLSTEIVAQHIKVMHKVAPTYTCPECEKEYSQISEFRAHLQNVHKRDTMYKCEHCGRTFGWRKFLRRHIREKHQGDGASIFAMRSDFKASKTILGDELDDSLKNHAEERRSPQEGEDDSFQDAPEQPTTIDDHEYDVDEAYEEEDREYSNKKGPKKEIKVNFFGPSVLGMCPICGKVLHTKTSMKTHIEASHHQIKRYACDQCDQAFYARYTLKNHIDSIHKGTKRFTCSECNKGFYLHQHLAGHMLNNHKISPPFKCNECGRRFAIKEVHDRHMWRFHTVKPKRKLKSTKVRQTIIPKPEVSAAGPESFQPYPTNQSEIYIIGDQIYFAEKLEGDQNPDAAMDQSNLYEAMQIGDQSSAIAYEQPGMIDETMMNQNEMELQKDNRNLISTVTPQTILLPSVGVAGNVVTSLSSVAVEDNQATDMQQVYMVYQPY